MTTAKRRKAKAWLWRFIGAATIALSVSATSEPRHFRPALPGYRFEFPRDHASHPAFQTEWWYYTGHLESGQRRFGYELTFFRIGVDAERRRRSAWAPHTVYLGHLALTDESRSRFRSAQVASRPALGLAGADTARYRVWIEPWSAELLPDGRTHRLRAARAGIELALDLGPLKPIVVHGRDGVSRKASALGRASHYYSLTRLATRGHLKLDGDSLAVTGTSWMDHEFGSNQLGPGQTGWDWFALQLDDGSELMLYRIRLANGKIEPMSSGTLVPGRGAAVHLERDDYRVEPTGTWTSPRSRATYPSGWTVEVPAHELVLRIEPTVADQELTAEGPAGVTYWEGAVRVEGRARGAPIRGRGYVELTGYAGPIPGF